METLSRLGSKSRLSKENQEVRSDSIMMRGLDRYFGLLNSEKGGLWKNMAGRYDMGDGKKICKEIYKNPEKYFTEEVMEKLDVIVQGLFSYGM